MRVIIIRRIYEDEREAEVTHTSLQFFNFIFE